MDAKTALACLSLELVDQISAVHGNGSWSREQLAGMVALAWVNGATAMVHAPEWSHALVTAAEAQSGQPPESAANYVRSLMRSYPVGERDPFPFEDWPADLVALGEGAVR